MAICCKLSTLMGEKRYNMQDVCDKTGLSRGTIAQLYHDKMKRFDNDTLDKLCTLFECSVGELIEHKKE